MTKDRDELRRKTGVRKLEDIDGTISFRMAFRPAKWTLASVHPAVVVSDDFAAADALAAELAGRGHPALAVESLPAPGGGAEARARRVEDVIRAARTLAHFTGGRTLNMHAMGSAVEAARTAYELERGYFDCFNGEGEMP